ncbi:MAG: hypothetical protein ACLFTP_00755 [Rhodosalinus sp.]
MRDFRAAYNCALKVVDDPDALPGDPVAAVTLNKERASNRDIMPEDLADWWARVDRVNACLLLDHTVPGIEGVYINERTLFDTLLAEQERMTTAILALLEPSTATD